MGLAVEEEAAEGCRTVVEEGRSLHKQGKPEQGRKGRAVTLSQPEGPRKIQAYCQQSI